MAGEKILVVEDNPANMILATDLLEISGFEVLQATNAEVGIDLARQHLPRVILMDVGLPDMDGLTAAGILLNDAATKDIPLVILTAHAMHGDKEKALEAGCSGYITKPIDTRHFIKAVTAYAAGEFPESCR